MRPGANKSRCAGAGACVKVVTTAEIAPAPGKPFLMPSLTPAELDALRLSLDIALRSVIFSLPLAVLVAYLLVRSRFPGTLALDALVHLPLVLPPVAELV